jgi:dipeptidyl aminopeptidase/acylaminoacyl peptidase
MRATSQRFWRRLAFALAAALAFLAVGLVLVPAYLYARAHTRPGCPAEYATPTDVGLEYEDVSFPSRDGPTLHGWFVPGSRHPEIAIISLPGLMGNRSSTLPDVAVLAEGGFSVLSYEHRTCADPSLVATLGYNEAYDLQGAADYLRARPGIEHIGVAGFSVGGVTAILGAADDPDIEAVAAMGGFHNLEADILDPDEQHDLYAQAMRRAIVWMMWAQMGIHPHQISPVDAIGRISPRPVLLIYGELEPGNSGSIQYRSAGEPKELWIVPGAGHGGYRQAAPGEYEQRLISFFNSAFAVEG